jgi:hypothetical protein
VNQVGEWVGSVWSHRNGRLLIGKLRSIHGSSATLAVVGLGPVVPEGVRVLPQDQGGASLVEIPLRTLLATWKRMGPALGGATVVESGH